MKDYIELKEDLHIARETNMRLHRRVQYLEGLVNKLYRQMATVPIHVELHRIRRYADKMKELYQDEYHRYYLRRQAAKPESFFTKLGNVLRGFYR